MMREILFRGKRIDNNEWVYGFYSQFYNRPVDNEPNSHQIFELLKENEEPIILGKTSIGGVWHIIKPETLGQYTGLTDKNGTKIFEGDIVKAKYKENREYMGVKYDDIMEFTEKVVWNRAFNCFCLEIDNEGIPMFRRLNFVEKTNNVQLIELEVIGNVWDNPKLLEE